MRHRKSRVAECRACRDATLLPTPGDAISCDIVRWGTMDEPGIAFKLPHARASATYTGPPLDRISVRDYVRDIEIGAFRSERGVTQRIRFNVVLEIGHTAAAATDDVDRVVSYDMITDAIEAALVAERLNLLETLAELAERDTTADMIDSTVVRAHHCAVGIKRDSANRGSGPIARRLHHKAARQMRRQGPAARLRADARPDA